MKPVKSILTWILMFTLLSCADFGDININPNQPVHVAPENLLTGALRSLSGTQTMASAYVQHLTETTYTENSRYCCVEFDFNYWYTGPLINLQHIIELNTDEETRNAALQSGSNANQIAVARILKAFFFHYLTDILGPIPYSEALKGRSVFQPGYDSQQFVYYDLLKELREAADQIDDGKAVRGDFLLGGDMDYWKIFANSLRAIISLRMSDVDPQKAKTEFTSALNSGIISSRSESVMYPHIMDSNNENPWYSGRGSRIPPRTDWAVTTTLVNYMKPLNDPRLNVYADDAVNYGEVVGMPYGIRHAGDIPHGDISLPGYPSVRGRDSPQPIITHAQMLFSLAEAVLRGWIAEDPAALYENAIRASWDQWGVMDETVFQQFIKQPEVAWDESRGLELIMQQKWVALYLQGNEAWAEWRRTGLPILTPSPDPLNESGEIPRRRGYPISERDLNSENYNRAVEFLGGPDDLDTRLWWDTN